MNRRPKRKKKSAAARLRPFWFLIGILAIAVAAGGYYAAAWPGFYPRSVTVSGNRVVPAQLILARARIAPRENLWLQNMGAASSRVRDIPYVKTAWLHRSLPANVRIQVTEREPYALVKYGAGSALVDRDLRVLRVDDALPSLPVLVPGRGAIPAAGAFIKDPAVLALREDYDALGRAHVVVASLRYDKFGDLVATMRSGVQLLLGDERTLPHTASLIGPILSQLSASGRKIAQVDLRAPKTPVVVFKK